MTITSTIIVAAVVANTGYFLLGWDLTSTIVATFFAVGGFILAAPSKKEDTEQ